MSMKRVISLFVFVWICYSIYLHNDKLHDKIDRSVNRTDRDLVDWRKRQEEVEKYCDAQQLNLSQHQQSPKVIF